MEADSKKQGFEVIASLVQAIKELRMVISEAEVDPNWKLSQMSIAQDLIDGLEAIKLDDDGKIADIAECVKCVELTQRAQLWYNLMIGDKHE